MSVHLKKDILAKDKDPNQCKIQKENLFNREIAFSTSHYFVNYINKED